MKKKIYLYIISFVLLALFCAMTAYSLDLGDVSPIALTIGSSEDKVVETIKVWKNTDGEYFAFLPAYADLEQVVLYAKQDANVKLDGVPVQNSILGTAVSLNRKYALTYTAWGREIISQITFIQSANLSTIYIETESASLDAIHAIKGNEEPGYMRIYSPNGLLEYEGNIKSIQGRGNTTWEGFEKKPYSVKLEAGADLLHMGLASDWVLLANAGDPSNIRNKMIYDFADRFGLSYSPDSAWVDLYLNGEYAGLYLLSEKNQVHSQRVALSKESGVLVSKENPSHLISKSVPKVTTATEQMFRIHNGDDLDAVQLHLQSVENAVLAENHIDQVTGKPLQDLIDMDSWARKYLVEEVFGNIDAGHASQFYYWDEMDGKVYAGPVWDYDNTFWENTEQCLFANQYEIKAGLYAEWTYALYNNPVFYNRVTQLFEEEFVPLLENLLANQIPIYEEVLTEAYAMNQKRWPEYNGDFQKELSYIQNYLANRQSFLADIWGGNTQYHIVRFDLGNNSNYLYFCVADGACLESSPVVDELRFDGWYYENTGKTFDLNHPVTEDIAVTAKWRGGDSTSKRILIEVVPIITIAGLFFIILAYDFKQTKNEMRRKNEKNR